MDIKLIKRKRYETKEYYLSKVESELENVNYLYSINNDLKVLELEELKKTLSYYITYFGIDEDIDYLCNYSKTMEITLAKVNKFVHQQRTPYLFRLLSAFKNVEFLAMFLLFTFGIAIGFGAFVFTDTHTIFTYEKAKALVDSYDSR